MSDHRVYSESEATEIVRRAVEIQEQKAKDADKYTPGVTREELERVAKEIGLSPDALERAIEELRANPGQKKSRFSMKEEVERVIDRELSPDDFDLVAEILRTKSSQTIPSQVGRTLQSKVMVAGSVADIAVTSRNGRTRINVRSMPLLGTIFGSLLAFYGLIFGGVLIGEHGNIAAGIAVMLFGMIAGVALFSGLLKSGRKGTQKLADDLAKRVEEEVEASQLSVRQNLATSASKTEPATEEESENLPNSQ